ncbi:hypothetical protein C8A05DRAFT_42227 [Staphylotrichum tortipilum]|uniref:PCI domain-containing protein n=1 Tax=Staphylotrichum tortipilum TaxID=2831512 RepID=A0AAN6RVQ2_9PEZI|nr:hypothetical protein C8A05DRAFT_42227 [Staphylotrichum longicolle]
MEQTKAINALEPFLALSKSATSPRAAADLIVRATSAPNTFIFTELLQTPQIQALASSDEFAQYLALLQVFSHGTYSSYTATPGLPALTDAQQLKLRQLSLLTLAKKDSTAAAGSPALDYASLQAALDLPSRQALEELVISAVYAGLLKAQLNPKASLVQINSVAPLRDVAPTAIGGLLSSLQSWAGRCESTLQFLSCQMTQLRADADRRAAKAAARREETKQLVENEKGGNAPILSHSSRATAAAAVPGSAVFTASPFVAAANMAAPRKPTRPDPPFHNPLSNNTNLNLNNGGGSGSGSTGGGSAPDKPTTANDEMKSVLTVGGNSSSSLHPPSGPSAGAGAPGAAHLEVSAAGSGGIKRGSGELDGDNEGADDQEDPDTDLNSQDDGGQQQQRASKRKLAP